LLFRIYSVVLAPLFGARTIFRELTICFRQKLPAKFFSLCLLSLFSKEKVSGGGGVQPLIITEKVYDGAGQDCCSTRDGFDIHKRKR
jgi:hypothetical protein